ncbi:MAG: hypothetical protein NY202_02555 [Mollicutes bacterium UO1]
MALKNQNHEVYSNLELLRYEFYAFQIKNAQTLTETEKVEKEIGEKLRGKYLPKGKKLSNLFEALNNKAAFIVLERAINNTVVPSDVDKINQELSVMRARATKGQEYAYHELNKGGEVDKKELELMKAKHLQVDDREKK